MFKKGTKFYSVVKGKCPRCQDGDFFKYGFTLNFNKTAKLHENCPKCGLKYMLEPSFFFGSMYVSYGLTVGLSIVIFLIAKLLFHITLLHTFFIIVASLLVLSPLNLRLARIIWINIFVDYLTTEFDKRE